MKNSNYKPIQIPAESHDKLKKYCDENGYKLGKFMETLIHKNCVLIDKKRILKVE